jgi:uncharacterized cupin superfamily protein
MRRANVHTVELGDEQSRPGYRWRAAALGPLIGAARMGATVYELPPGEATFPYHYEHGCEEWLLVVNGPVTLRDPDGEHTLTDGDVVCFPEGPDGAHRVHNTGADAARIVIFSTKQWPAAAVFPDSGKTLLLTGEGDGPLIVRTGDAVGYWEGEA